MKRFVKTYIRKGTNLLRLALGIYEGTSSLGKSASSVYECQSEVND